MFIFFCDSLIFKYYLNIWINLDIVSVIKFFKVIF